MRVYGSEISYFTGKFEAYLRYKRIPYERIAMTPGHRARARSGTGASQMPAVELPDGRWMTDTTPMIAWLETQHPEPAVIPRDPFQAFASRLLEDYADEWMWRPALHYRWSFLDDRRTLSRRIVSELMRGIPLPTPVKRRIIELRQLRKQVWGDGVTRETRAHVEGTYLRTLDQLQPILEQRPFLLGARPTLADFGFFASMFRHFGLDPTPASIMRGRAPAVYEWLARLWNAGNSQPDGPLAQGIPEDWGPILQEMGETYLPYLCANAEAWKRGQKRFDVEIQGVPYRKLLTLRYRVWCLERLRAHQSALPEAAAAEARALLEKHGCQEPLWRVESLDSGYDPDGKAPFGAGLEVFRSSLPSRVR